MAEELFLEIHHFEPLVGKTVRFGGTMFAMPLLKVIKGQKFLPTAKREPFMLVFRAPKTGTHMGEGMYDCAFDEGPTYKFYVSPVYTPEPEWQDYQAIFN